MVIISIQAQEILELHPRVEEAAEVEKALGALAQALQSSYSSRGDPWMGDYPKGNRTEEWSSLDRTRFQHLIINLDTDDSK